MHAVECRMCGGTSVSQRGAVPAVQELACLLDQRKQVQLDNNMSCVHCVSKKVRRTLYMHLDRQHVVCGNVNMVVCSAE